MPALNWSTAQVREGKLRVELEGELPRGWKQSFATTVKLLAGEEWGGVECKKRSVRVADVRPGEEERLAHFLESVVQQANASHPPPEPDEDADEPAAGGEEPDLDAEMTSRFRALADQPDKRS